MQRVAMLSETKRRVGWIRIGALGDLLVGLASLREVLDAWPNAQVTVIGTPLLKEIIEPGAWPQIDRLAIVEKRGKTAEIYDRVVLNEDRGESQWKKRAAPVSLRSELSGYDVVFNARVDSPRQGFAAFFAGVRERWGSAEGFANFIYNRRAPHDGKDPLIHERDVPLLLMDEAERGGKLATTLAERLNLSPRVQKWKAKGLPCPRVLHEDEAKRIAGTSEKYFIINPTSSRREKAWPSAKFRELLLSGIAKEKGLRPLIVGAPNETEWLREVAIGDGSGEKFPIVQPKSIGELFQLVAGAEFLVANTSSVQFVAGAVGTPVLTLMGRAKPEIWGPVGPKDSFILGSEPKDLDDMFERERQAYATIEVAEVLKRLRAK